MEEQLAAYRAKKAKEIRNSAPSKLNTGGILGTGLSVSLFTRNRRKDASQHQQDDTVSTATSELIRDEDSTSSRVKEEEVNPTDSSRTQITPQRYSSKPYSSFNIDPYQLALKTIIWMALFGLFICIGFGAVYFILSLFYIIYANLRGEGEQTPGEKSAYSVFNPECERIHGTLTAEEIQKGMLYGIGGAVK